MRKSKRDIIDDFEKMSEVEILHEYNPHVNIEFDIMGIKYVFRNVNNKFLSDFSIYEFIRELEIKTIWYNDSAYDTVFVKGVKFLIIEYSRKKIVAVRSNGWLLFGVLYRN